ncbi:MAG TPA: RyR domain-containing protein [Blattabacteriaceae bacterium]
MKIEDIARIAHEANKAYCESLGDFSQFLWSQSPDWQKDYVIAGVKFRLKNTHGTAEENHSEWLKIRLQAGWKYSSIKNVEKKEHPNMVPYDRLPELQRVKDVLFISIVDGLKEFLE